MRGRGNGGRGNEGKGREREERGTEGGDPRGEGRLTLMRSWNRAADWLRPALSICLKFFYVSDFDTR